MGTGPKNQKAKKTKTNQKKHNYQKLDDVGYESKHSKNKFSRTINSLAPFLEKFYEWISITNYQSNITIVKAFNGNTNTIKTQVLATNQLN